jgi:alkaline phosphatase
MACKLRCPVCWTMCKEEGDEMKEAYGTYTVEKKDSVNWLTCSACCKTTLVTGWKSE